MKPRTKHERHIVDIAKHLPALTETQKQYAYEHCFQHLAILRKGQYHCSDCGHSWTPMCKEEVALDAECGTICPNCGHALRVEKTRKQKWTDESTFQIVTTAGDVQFVRTFHTNKQFHVGQPAFYWICEAIQIAITPGKGDVVIARPRSMSWYSDSYIFTKEMSIKANTSNCGYNYYGLESYYITAAVVYPRRKVLPILKRNGYSKALYEFPTVKMIKMLIDNPHIETLVKAGRLDILDTLNEREINDFWPQIRLVIRHNYRPNSIIEWRDTVKLANKLNLDTLSPKYILPADLTTMHNLLSRRYTTQQQREERERIIQSNAWYRKVHKKLLNVVINENGMHISPLQCKEDFIEEGRAMHHCVATYFDKSSLILSVRTDDDNRLRLATVELDGKDFKIIQCRAKFNAIPQRYNDIVSLINRHRSDFVKAAPKVVNQ